MLKVKLKHCDGPCQSDKQIWVNKNGKRYCRDCWFKMKPTKPLSRSSLTKSQKSIPKQSNRRKKEQILYSSMRLQFLKYNPICKMNIPGLCTKIATEVQHLKGRGKYYLDMTFWMSACHFCHSYATDHPAEAIENGWAILKLTK